MADFDLGGATFVISANATPLEQQLRRAESATRQATTEMATDWRKVEQATRQAAERIAENVRKVEEAGRRAEEALSMGSAGGRFNNPAMGLLYVSQAVEDAQYGRLRGHAA